MGKVNLGGRPLKFKTAPELAKKIDKYFKSCWEPYVDHHGNTIFYKNKEGKNTNKRVFRQTRPYTIAGLCAFLDCSDETVLNYEKKGKFFGIIKKAKAKIYAYAVDALYTNQHSQGVKFALTNVYGWTEKIAEEIHQKVTIIEDQPK